MRNGQDIADGYEPLFVDRFSNDNGFAANLHEGGTTGVAQEDNDQDGNNDDDSSNMDEDTENPPRISFEPASARRKISGVHPPENLVELPGVAPPENQVKLPGVNPLENEVYDDVVTPLFPSEYKREDKSNEGDEDKDISTQHRQILIHPEAMPPTVRNV